MSQIDLSQNLKGMVFKNPLTLLSGNAGFGTEYKKLKNFSYESAGAVFLKGTTIKPRVGNKLDRVVESSSGLINSVGLENPGVEVVIEQLIQKLDLTKTNYIPNLCGTSIYEYTELCKRFNDTNISALEINISCPNVEKAGAFFGSDPSSASRLISACRKATDKALIVKLSPNLSNIAEGVKAVIESGAEMISAINTYPALAIDVETRRPMLGNNSGGLSGPAIKPIALLKIHQIYQETKKLNIPIIGQGGIFSWQDAVEFILAGANLVGVGTALAKDPFITDKILQGITKYMKRHKLSKISELVGKLQFN